MRSFRLDPESVTEFFQAWPALLMGGLLAGVSVYLGLVHHWGPVCGIFMGGTCGVYLIRGVTARRLKETYPGARSIWLLTAGITAAVFGAATMLALPRRLGPGFDLAWLGISFFSILGFVIVNRKNADVIR
jgi:hypothetical protein